MPSQFAPASSLGEPTVFGLGSQGGRPNTSFMRIGPLSRCGLVPLALLLIVPTVLRAVEKNGLRVDVTATTLDRADGKGNYKEIDRTMALKVKVRNTSMKPRPEGELEYTIFVKRWGYSESGTYESYKGTVKLEALLPSKEVEVRGDEFRLGGHMHGTSRMHVDDLAGWKVVVRQGDQVTECSSSSNVAGMAKSAQPGR